VRELSSPRVDQSARCPVRELAVRELAYPRVVQLPVLLVCPYGRTINITVRYFPSMQGWLSVKRLVLFSVNGSLKLQRIIGQLI